ncbi:hypothetical protein GDO78_014581 [Eleutherodactylus coqui]|uniref:Secreted protein n=1 Tax=Eleutherodactylus coqui TaxID=57060 RepID=A0A8J6B1C0_ELECQ|nr:hypothetical protein GDO78_014581 [Eleutherodactylus coqui]
MHALTKRQTGMAFIMVIMLVTRLNRFTPTSAARMQNWITIFFQTFEAPCIIPCILCKEGQDLTLLN